MRLEHCSEHFGCTIVDGEHTLRRPTPIPEGMAHQESVDALSRAVYDRLTRLEQGLKEGLDDARSHAETDNSNTEARLSEVRNVVTNMAEALTKLRQEVSAKLEQESHERAATPNRVRETLARQDKIDSKLSDLVDDVVRLGEAIKQEATDREAAIRQVVRL